MRNDGRSAHLVFHIPTRGLVGFRNAFLTATKGEGVMNTLFLGYEPWAGEIAPLRGGVLLASADGVAVTYGLNNAQGRGITFIGPGTQVYEGMLVGATSCARDIPVNVCKEKKQTNIRSSTSDIAVKLTPPMRLSLEEALGYVNDDELVEVTPKNIRLRKKLLVQRERVRASHAARRSLDEETD